MNAPDWARFPRGTADLRSRTSIGVGGLAERFYVPGNVDDLRHLLLLLWDEGEEPFILGGGCNTLFCDRAFRRPILHTEKLQGLEVRGTRIRAEAGVRLESLVRIAVESGLAGLEKFCGIPGTVGGAVFMNAGGSDVELGELVRRVIGIDPGSGDVVDVPGENIRWHYRRAELNGLVVTSVELELVAGDPRVLRARAHDFLRWKASRQPLGSHNAGCIFRNPPGQSAGWLVEKSGLKGQRVGRAVVSRKHANFIINECGRATASDVTTLIDLVRSRVEETFGVRLELEIVLPRDGRPDLRERGASFCAPVGE